MITIKNWNDEEFTLDELEEIVDACDVGEQSFDELAGCGDLATTPAIVRNLIRIIKDQEKIIQQKEG